MSISSDVARRRLTWAAPVVVAGIVAAGIAVSTGSASGASPDLPARTPAQLIAAVAGSSTTALSGVVSETANLGLPTLPGDQSSASLSWQTFITGSHSAKVWIDGKDKQRVALLGELSEADVVHNGKDLWTYTSQTNTVTHTVLPAREQHDSTSTEHPDARDVTPSAVAANVLKAVSPSTKVSVDTTQMVAGRPAYTLVLQPRDTRSTVSKVTIAVDAATSVPLQVQVFGSGSSPAIQVGFTSIEFTTPAASTFDFVKPAGASVSNDAFGSQHHDMRYDHVVGRQGYHALNQNSTPLPRTEPMITRMHGGHPSVIGSGWTTVVELPAGQAGALDNGTVQDATTAGPNGERLLHTALINAVLMPDGRVFAGAVDQSYLEHVAATH